MPTKKLFEFRESGLVFQFDNHWVIEKYDTHRFYKTLSGAGLKGVDFLGFYEEKLILIEVKNYRIRYHDKPPVAIYNILENPDLLKEKVRRKAKDTIQALRVINKYYERKTFPRLFKPIYQLLKNTRFYTKTPLFWQDAFEAVQTGNYSLVLWLETQAEYPDFSAQKVQEFHTKLRAGAAQKESQSFTILSLQQKKHTFQTSLKVEIEKT